MEVDREGRHSTIRNQTKKSVAPITAFMRLKKDYSRLHKDPVPYIVAEPLPSNILEWHYVVTGPEDSLYKGGFYHGKLKFPSEFPFKPPSIYMTTPNGRFKTNTRLCLSISDYHPDTWNPAWSVSTILTGLLSFMLEKSPTLGSVETSDGAKRKMAAESHAFNLKDKNFVELFPEMATKSRHILARIEMQGSAATRSTRESRSLENNSGIPENRLEENAAENRGLCGAVTNFIVIGGFAVFAFVVQYVVQSLA